MFVWGARLCSAEMWSSTFLLETFVDAARYRGTCAADRARSARTSAAPCARSRNGHAIESPRASPPAAHTNFHELSTRQPHKAGFRPGSVKLLPKSLS